jgi:hypothetical protein
MEHLLDCGVLYRPEVMDEAALKGHLHVVEWLAERFPEGCTPAVRSIFVVCPFALRADLYLSCRR